MEMSVISVNSEMPVISAVFKGNLIKNIGLKKRLKYRKF